MEPSPDTPSTPRPRLDKEYEDPHYHDDIDVAVPVDDVDHSESRPPLKRKPSRRPPPRRYYED